MKITTPETQCITYTALISRRLMQYSQIPMSCTTRTTDPKPDIITPQAILTGGCNKIRIWPLLNFHSGAIDYDSGSDIGNAPLYLHCIQHSVSRKSCCTQVVRRRCTQVLRRKNSALGSTVLGSLMTKLWTIWSMGIILKQGPSSSIWDLTSWARLGEFLDLT